MAFSRVAILYLPDGSTYITERINVTYTVHMEGNFGLNVVKLSSWVTGCHVGKFYWEFCKYDPPAGLIIRKETRPDAIANKT
jgi:hypothetical protein